MSIDVLPCLAARADIAARFERRLDRHAGLTVDALVAAWVVRAAGRRWMYIAAAVPGVLALLIRRTVPESPRRLADSGLLEEAAAVMDPGHLDRLVLRVLRAAMGCAASGAVGRLGVILGPVMVGAVYAGGTDIFSALFCWGVSRWWAAQWRRCSRRRRRTGRWRRSRRNARACVWGERATARHGW